MEYRSCLVVEQIDLNTHISTLLVNKTQQFLSKGPAGTEACKDTPAAHFYCIILFACECRFIAILLSPILVLPLFLSVLSFCTFSSNPGEVTRIAISIFFALINSGLFCFFFCHFLCLNLQEENTHNYCSTLLQSLISLFLPHTVPF